MELVTGIRYVRLPDLTPLEAGSTSTTAMASDVPPFFGLISQVG
jgi:hypothetical protein